MFKPVGYILLSSGPKVFHEGKTSPELKIKEYLSLELKKVLAQFSKLHQNPVFKSNLSQTSRNILLSTRPKKSPRCWIFKYGWFQWGSKVQTTLSGSEWWRKTLEAKMVGAIPQMKLHGKSTRYAHGNEWRPEALSLSNKSCFKLEEKRGQKSH